MKPRPNTSSALPALLAALPGLLALSCGAAQPSHVAWRIPGAMIAGRDGRAYVQDYTSPSLSLSRLALPEGKRLWTADAVGQLDPSCAYADALVTAADGQAQALDPETGRELWRMAADELAGDGTPLLTCPEAGAAFYAVRVVGANALAAFGKNTGGALWRYAPGGYVAVAYADEELVLVDRAANAPEALVALDAATGAVRWTVRREGSEAVTVRDGVPYLVSGGKLAKIDRATGAVSGDSSAGGRAPEAGGERRLSDALGGVYRLRANRDLARLDADGGGVLWTFPVGVFGELLGADEDAVYFTLLDVGPQVRTTVVAVRRRSGRERWREDLRAAAQLVTEDASHLYFTTTSPEAGTVSVAVSKR